MVTGKKLTGKFEAASEPFAKIEEQTLKARCEDIEFDTRVFVASFGLLRKSFVVKTDAKVWLSGGPDNTRGPSNLRATTAVRVCDGAGIGGRGCACDGQRKIEQLGS